MKTKTRKYKNKNRKTRRGGAAPGPITPPPEANPSSGSSWFSSFSLFGTPKPPSESVTNNSEFLKNEFNKFKSAVSKLDIKDIENKSLSQMLEDIKNRDVIKP